MIKTVQDSPHQFEPGQGTIVNYVKPLRKSYETLRCGVRVYRRLILFIYSLIKNINICMDFLNDFFLKFCTLRLCYVTQERVGAKTLGGVTMGKRLYNSQTLPFPKNVFRINHKKTISISQKKRKILIFATIK